jgi:hypothetical protein
MYYFRRWLDSEDTQRLLQHILHTRVTVKNPLGKDAESLLGRAGKPLARAYAAASTTTSRDDPIKLEDWWVQSGPPLLFVIVESEEYVYLPPRSREVTIPPELDFQLDYCLIPFAGKQIRTWVLTLNPQSDLVAARTLRLYLTRLNAEHECLRIVLRHIENGRISVSRGTEPSEALQFYLNEVTKRISRWECRSGRLISEQPTLPADQNQDEFYYAEIADIADIARSSEDLIDPGRRDGLLERL